MNTEHTNQSTAPEPVNQLLLDALEQLVRVVKLQRPWGASVHKAEKAIAAAEQAQQAVPVAMDVIAKLIALTRAVNLALDDCEERDGIDGREHVIDSVNFDAVCDALEALEELPDNKPGWAMSAADKAEWALRCLSSTQQQSATADPMRTTTTTITNQFGQATKEEIKKLAEFLGFEVRETGKTEPDITLHLRGTGLYASTDGALVYRELLITRLRITCRDGYHIPT